MRSRIALVASVLCCGWAIPAWSQNASLLEEAGFAHEGPAVQLYGFVMADIGHNFGRIDPDWYDVVRPTKLPSYENEFGKDGDSFFSVRQTRFGVKSWLPTDGPDVRLIFEWELFGVGDDAGQTTFRLRHAYAQYGRFGVGQYWSVFMDIDVFPNSIEYWGPTGMVFFRNIQLRYMPVTGKNHVAISLERPGASGDRGRFKEVLDDRNIIPRHPLPDLAAEYRRSGKWGHVEVAGILRHGYWDDLSDDPIDLSGSATGWGINLSTNVNLGPGVAKGSLVFGEGIQNYMNDATADVFVLTPTTAGAVSMLGMVLFYDLQWNERFSSTLGYSMQNQDLEDTAATPSTFESGQYALANLLFYPAENLMAGLELQWGRRKNLSDDWTYDDFRIQLSFRARFSAILGGPEE